MQHCWGYRSSLFPKLSSQEAFCGAGVAAVPGPAALSPPPRPLPAGLPGAASALGARARHSPMRPKLSDKVLRNFFILLIFSADCESIMSHIGGRPPAPAGRPPRSPGSGGGTAAPAPGLSPSPEQPPGQRRSRPGKEPYALAAAAAAAAGAAGAAGLRSASLIAPHRRCPSRPDRPRQRRAATERPRHRPAGGCGPGGGRDRGREGGRQGALRERRRRSLGGPGSPGEEGRRRRGREGDRRGALGPGPGMRAG